MNKIPYQSALITGASSGIGKTFAYTLAQLGINLVLTARSEDKLSQVADDLSTKFAIKVSYIVADLSQPDAALTIYNDLMHRDISIDLLINNAGNGNWTNFLNEPMSSYNATINLNMTSLVALTHYLLPAMVKNKKGGIINIASGAALQPGPFMAVYAASKAFVLSFSEALYGEFFDKGITITAICPGNTPTEFQAASNANTEGMPVTTPQEVVDASIDALLKHKNYKIVGTMNYIQSFAPRFLPRKTIINIMNKLMGKRVNP